MGFSLVGNSGDQTTNTNIYETSYSASINPQFSLAGAAPGDVAVDLAPTLQNSQLSGYVPQFSSLYAPISILTTGNLQGDSALSALQGLAQTQATSQTGAASPSLSLSTLLSGNAIYYILGAIAILFLAHHKGGS